MILITACIQTPCTTICLSPPATRSSSTHRSEWQPRPFKPKFLHPSGYGLFPPTLRTYSSHVQRTYYYPIIALKPSWLCPSLENEMYSHTPPLPFRSMWGYFSLSPGLKELNFQSRGPNKIPPCFCCVFFAGSLRLKLFPIRLFCTIQAYLLGKQKHMSYQKQGPTANPGFPA